MSLAQRENHCTKRKIALMGWLCVIGLCDVTMASRNSPSPGVTGGPAGGSASCMDCHGSTVGTGSISIIGAPATYQPSAIYNLTVRIADAGQVGAGFQLSVENSGGHVGSLIVTDAANTVVNPFDANYINHTSAGVVDSVAGWAGLSSAAEYSVQWQAPATDAGIVTFWAAGNAINDNSSATGDVIYLTSAAATFEPGAVPTVSTWGIIAMALLVALVGSVLLRVRQSVVL